MRRLYATEVSVIVDVGTLILLVVLYFAYDRHAVPRRGHDDVEGNPCPEVTSHGHGLPFRRHVGSLPTARPRRCSLHRRTQLEARSRVVPP